MTIYPRLWSKKPQNSQLYCKMIWLTWWDLTSLTSRNNLKCNHSIFLTCSSKTQICSNLKTPIRSQHSKTCFKANHSSFSNLAWWGSTLIRSRLNRITPLTTFLARPVNPVPSKMWSPKINHGLIHLTSIQKSSSLRSYRTKVSETFSNSDFDCLFTNFY